MATICRKIRSLLLALLCCHSAFALAERPVVVIIIDDLGYELQAGKLAASLPGKVNLAILPHTPNGAAVARLGLAAGKEIMLHTPMANLNARPLGRGGLTAGMDEAELRQTLAKNIASTPGVRGINNHMGSLLTARAEPMSWVMQELASRGLYFVDSRTTADTVAATMAEQYGVPHLARHVFLDNQIDSTAIHYQFKHLLAVADEEGLAIGIGHPHEATLRYLNRQLKRLDRAGYRLALISEVLADRMAYAPEETAAAKP